MQKPVLLPSETGVRIVMGPVCNGLSCCLADRIHTCHRCSLRVHVVSVRNYSRACPTAQRSIEASLMDLRARCRTGLTPLVPLQAR